MREIRPSSLEGGVRLIPYPYPYWAESAGVTWHEVSLSIGPEADYTEIA